MTAGPRPRRRRCAPSWPRSTRAAALRPARAGVAGLGRRSAIRRPPCTGPARGPARPAGTGRRPASAARRRSPGRPRATTAGRPACAGLFLARGSLSLANGRTHLEFVVDAGRGLRPLAARLARRSGCRPSSRVRRGRGVVTWKSAETIGTLPALGRRRRRAPRARGAPGLAGGAGATSTGCINAESANLDRAVEAAGRQLGAIATLDADGRLADQPHVVRAGRRRPPGDRRRRRSASSPSGSAIHRSAVQRALERIERLASHDDDPARPRSRGPTGTHDGPAASIGRGGGVGMISAMRPVIIAANWKMHTVPSEAGELARDDRRADRASRTSSGSSARRSSASPPSATRSRGAASAVGAQNVHHELAGAYTGEVSAPMLAGLAPGSSSATPSVAAMPARRTPSSARKLGRAIEAGLRPILCVGELLADREAGRARGGRRGPAARAPSAGGTARRRGSRARAASSSPTSRSGPSGPGRTARGADAGGDGRRDPRDAGATSAAPDARGGRAGPLRRQRHRAPTSGSSWPSRRSTGRSSAARRSSPTRWPGSSAGPASRRRPGPRAGRRLTR